MSELVKQAGLKDIFLTAKCGRVERSLQAPMMGSSKKHPAEAGAANIRFGRRKHAHQQHPLQHQTRGKEKIPCQIDHEDNASEGNFDIIIQDGACNSRHRKHMKDKIARMINDYEEQRQQEFHASNMALEAEEDLDQSCNRNGVECLYEVEQGEGGRGNSNIQSNVIKVMRKESRHEEFNYLFDILWGDKLEQKRARERRLKKIRQAEMKRVMIAAYHHMLRNTAQIRQEEMENEALMIHKMRETFSKDEAKDELRDERRRLKESHYRSLADKLRNEKMQKCDDERDKELEISAEDTRREQYKIRVLKEARKRLLEEHILKLLAYLPSLIFADTDDQQCHNELYSPREYHH